MFRQFFGLFCFLSEYDPIMIGIYTFGGYLGGLVFTILGIFDKNILSIGILYSYLSRFGIFLIIAGILGYMYTGLEGVIGFLLLNLLVI